jgi:hypothetical protein
MRIAAVAMLVFTLSCNVLAQADAETPRQSFEKFIEAVLSDTLTKEQRVAQFERYFDFEQWLAERGGEYTGEERSAMKEDWLDLFQSAEFRDSYRAREVRVIDEPGPDLASGKAELLIAMKGDAGEEKFRVMMRLSEDGTWWRWYSIPQVVPEAAPMTPTERLKAVEESLAKIAQERRRLDELEDALRSELVKLRAAEAEADTGNSPMSIVTAAWTAIEQGDANALLDCHTTEQVARSKLETVKAGIDETRERLMSWEVQQATIDENDDTRAVVPVRVSLRRTGEPDVRTISVRVVKVGRQWKIDEAP